ncbi:unnamed protein product [Linum trigynum]|uniref:Uncharacterized protein n=1 Tax=Linum trigynum TaxID=586398 RepID=A0AAV2EBS7_9ROSI
MLQNPNLRDSPLPRTLSLLRPTAISPPPSPLPLLQNSNLRDSLSDLSKSKLVKALVLDFFCNASVRITDELGFPFHSQAAARRSSSEPQILARYKPPSIHEVGAQLQVHWQTRYQLHQRRFPVVGELSEIGRRRKFRRHVSLLNLHINLLFST